MNKLIINIIFSTLLISNFKNCSEKQVFIEIQDCNSIIVGDTVSVYDELGINANRTDYYNILTFAKISETTSQRIVLDNAETNCEKYGYFWYKIETKQGVKGWVYGKNIFKFVTDAESSPHYLLIGKKFFINDKYFYFGIADDVSFPTIISTEISGCVNYSFPFFYEPVENKIYPIKFDLEFDNEQEILATFASKNWLLIESSENVIDKIEDIEFGNDIFLFTIIRNFSYEIVTLKLTAELKDNYVETMKKTASYN